MENTISNSSSIKAVCFHLAQLLKLNKSKSIVAYKQLLAVVIADQKKVNSEYSYEDFRVMLNNGIVDDSLKAKMNMFKGKIEVKTLDFLLNSYSIIAIMIYVFTQSLIFFLIITINKNMNTIIVENNLTITNENYKKYKRQMHIHTSSNILFIQIILLP